MITLYLVLILLSLLALNLFKKCWRKNYPPGPWGVPIFGNLLQIDKNAPHLSLTEIARKYGPVCAIRMGSVYTVLVSDPQIIRQIFAQDVFSGRAPLYLTHGIMKGYGIICAEGDLWRDQRKFVAKSLKNFGMVKFQNEKRDELEKRIIETVEECIEKFRALSSEKGFDPSDTIHHCVGTAMNDLVFGKKFLEDDLTWTWLRHIQEEGVKQLGVAGVLNFLPFFRFLPQFKNIMPTIVEGQKKTHDLYKEWIDEHQNNPIKLNNFVAAFSEEMQKSNKDESFNFPQFYYLLADLHGAGTDTTMTTLRWFFLLMAAFPEEQKKIQDEMSSVLGSQKPTLKDRPDLPKLEAALLESQRFRTTVPLGVPHGTKQDTKIGDYDVPKGTMVVPMQWAIHTNEKYWDQPEEFKPERFLNSDGSVAKYEALLPFQYGKRSCIGEELAKMAIFLYTSHILYHFTISHHPDQIIDLEGIVGFTLIPKSHRLIFTPRYQPS